MRLSSLLFLFILAISCNPREQSIDFGHVSCHFCKMTVVDERHAAQFVNTKGKAFHFDAIECMINFHLETDQEAAVLSVCDYGNPGTLIPATESTFLISRQIPSPMGAFLSGFFNPDDAAAAQSEHGGKTYSWNELIQQVQEKGWPVAP